MIRVQEIARHRNGVHGEPFYVVKFKPTRGNTKGPRMVAVLFAGDAGADRETFGRPRTAVFDLDLLGAGTIAFAENSWRGDEFDSELRAAVRAQDSEFI